MFITLNNNNDCMYNALLIASFKKDIENLKIIYTLQNGSKLEELFEAESDLDSKFNTVCELSIGGGGGVANYAELESIPTINGVKIIGDMSLSDLGLMNEVILTRAEYDRLEIIDPNTKYIIKS